MMHNTLKIKDVIEVVDTREYEEIGDKWKPIRGSATVDALASMLWAAARGATLPSQFYDLADKQQIKLRMVVREALSRIVEAARRHLDECPDEPVSFEAIAAAAEMEQQND